MCVCVGGGSDCVSNLVLNQTPNLSNYSKYAAITPATSISTDMIEPLL